ncbi:Hypothetical predicted protein, partial [Marmota monax]
SEEHFIRMYKKKPSLDVTRPVNYSRSRQITNDDSSDYFIKSVRLYDEPTTTFDWVVSTGKRGCHTTYK